MAGEVDGVEQRCVGLGWAFAVSDPVQGLTLADVTELRRKLGVWFATTRAAMMLRVRTLVALGLLMADGRGLDRVLGYFDVDRDGALSQEELSAGVMLDERTMPEVLSDPDAVDQVALAQRLELPLEMVQRFFP